MIIFLLRTHLLDCSVNPDQPSRRPQRIPKKHSQTEPRMSPHPSHRSPQSQSPRQSRPSQPSKQQQQQLPSPPKSPNMPNESASTSPIAAFAAVAATLPNPIANPPTITTAATLPAVNFFTFAFFPWQIAQCTTMLEYASSTRINQPFWLCGLCKRNIDSHVDLMREKECLLAYYKPCGRTDYETHESHCWRVILFITLKEWPRVFIIIVV